MTDTAEIKTSPMETHSALPPEETERLSGEIVAALKTVFDPEIPADIYELGLIVVVDDAHTWRQRLINLGYFFFDALDYLLGVFVDALEDDSGDDLSITVFSHGTLADLVADFHSRNVADANRRAAA